jgi:hypothetical protein
MSSPEFVAGYSQILARRLDEGRLPVPEALRQLHDSGLAHGAVSPETTALLENKCELIPRPGPPDAVHRAGSLAGAAAGRPQGHLQNWSGALWVVAYRTTRV